MQALLVVDFLQELPDQSLGFLEVAILGAVDFLVFESLDETLCLGFVVWRSQSAHADANAVLFEQCGVISRSVLHTTGGMGRQPRPWMSSHACHAHCCRVHCGLTTA